MKKTIGGDRLGAGNKMQVDLRTYNRSSHDLGETFRSSMAAGTLVPFLKKIAMPGDTWDIELQARADTHPAVGPMFGSFKMQLDVFLIPIRLYQSQIQVNKLGIGKDMSKVKLPQIKVQAEPLDLTKDSSGRYITSPDIQQVNASALLRYLGISGVGTKEKNNTNNYVERKFSAVPLLGYWDIYKNYYANKQEEIGVVIHNGNATVTSINNGSVTIPKAPNTGIGIAMPPILNVYYTSSIDFNNVLLNITGANGAETVALTDYYDVTNVYAQAASTTLKSGRPPRQLQTWDELQGTPTTTNLQSFPLEEIDNMKEDIIAAIKQQSEFIIDGTSKLPYSLQLKAKNGGGYVLTESQEGLGVKTYQSDKFNNWISTEWLDGAGGINEITAIDTSSGSFNVESLILARKVYDMLNRIAISGGTYQDWLEVTYTHEGYKRQDTPIYQGGLIKELTFEEVVSTADVKNANVDQALGTLGGRGVMTGKHKGGKLVIRVDEPSYIMGIVSLTPRVDYSQGNDWDMNLKTWGDFHNPALDEIGFQDLITDQMAFWDTQIDQNNVPIYKSAGKQPAWLNYMTSVNKTYGTFAEEDNEMFMTLNRRYEMSDQLNGIKDLTTYIDPEKQNHIFAHTKRDAQNFWVQIGMEITKRSKMSAKIMPNL